jgi:hypothetical protein
MKSNNYYLHINSSSLAHYFVDGCIKPSSLIRNRIRDFQDNCSDKIILSTKKWNKDSDCSVEVILKSEECKELEELGKDYYLYNSALPISRVKTVLFLDKETAKDVAWKINSTAAFIPERIIKTENRLSIDTIKDFTEVKNVKNNSIEVLKKRLKRYDKLMGGIAFMRASLVCIEDEKINFSVNYFDTISYFNKSIKKEVENSNVKINKTFHNIFSLIAPVTRFLNQKLDKSIVEKMAKEEKLNLESNFGILNLENLPYNSLTYKLALLNTYGREESKSVDELIQDLLPKLKPSEAEEIALTFGLYYGYNSIRNYYKFINKKVVTKFELKSNIDYYIIESLFQYTFNSKQVNDSFDWLGSVIPKGVKTPVSFDYKSHIIFGNTVILGKNDYSHLLNEILENVSNEICNWFPKNIISINKEIVSEKLKSIIKPKVRKIVKEVQVDVSRSLKLNESDDSISIVNNKKTIKNNKQDSLDNILDPAYKKPESTVPVLDKMDKTSYTSEIDSELKKPFKEDRIEVEKRDDSIKPNLFNASENAIVEKTKEPIKNRLNSSQLNKKFKAPELKQYAKTLGLDVPDGLNKPGVIKFILSNQD